MKNILINHSLKISSIFLLFIFFYVYLKIDYNHGYLAFFFITTILLSLLISFKFFKEINSETIMILFVFFIVFYNLSFYIFYFLKFLELDLDNQNSNLTYYFDYFENYNYVIYVILANFIFFFFFVFFFKVILHSKKKFNLKHLRFNYSFSAIFLTLGSIFVLDLFNQIFLKSKVLSFLTSDSYNLIFIYLIINCFIRFKLQIYLKLFLFFLLSVFYFVLLFFFLELNIFNISRGSYFIYIFSFFNFLLLSHFFNNKYLKKMFFILTAMIFLIPFIIFDSENASLFHLFSEIQINRNLSIIVRFTEENNLEFLHLDYVYKFFYDILPFSGSQRGFTALIPELMVEIGKDPGDTMFNFGILSEGYLFYSFIGIVIVAFFYSIFLKIINYIFYNFKNNLFINICFCHIVTQSYWFYRGGLSLFIRKVYYFSFIYIVLVLLLSFYYMLVSRRIPK